MKVDFSNFLRLNLQDLLRGFIVSAVTVVLGSLLPIIQSGHFPTGTEFKSIGLAALLAGIAYLIKNLFTPQPDTVVVDPKKTDVVDSNTGKKIA